jgi:uncharacterized membrane protein YdjX (TVP38/TMEM64 family)
VDRRRLGLALALAAVVGAALLVAPGAALTRLSWLAADPLRYGLACLALAAVRPLVAWPTSLLAVAVGFGYGAAGPPFAFALALVVLTSLAPYALARRLGGSGRIAAAGRRVTDATGELRAVVAARLLPAPSDATSLALGGAGVGPGSYLLGTAAGEAPWALAGLLAGASLGSLRTGAGVEGVVGPRLVVAATLAAGLVLAGPAWRAYRA